MQENIWGKISKVKKYTRVLETALKIVMKKEHKKIDPWNHLGWKKPLVNLALPNPPLNMTQQSV